MGRGYRKDSYQGLMVGGKIRKVLYDTGADKGFGSPKFLKDIKSKPITARQATIRAIDGSTLRCADLKIHNVKGTIPTFGSFSAELERYLREMLTWY
jgi:hypothetical protein